MLSGFKVRTIFDHGVDHPGGIAYANIVEKSLRRIFPDPFFLDGWGDVEASERQARFEAELPIFKFSIDCGVLSLFFLARWRPNLGRFFYDMISRWLMPGKRVDIAFFFTADFSLFDDQIYTLAEMVVQFDVAKEREMIVHNLRIIDTEIRLGMVSVYHASRLLEMRSGGEKGAQVQEKISWLIQKRPEQIDYDIFGEMQHFLVLSSEEFKAARQATHLARLIAVFYSFRKTMLKLVSGNPLKRSVYAKWMPVILDFPGGMKRVLGLAVALNRLKAHEIFEEQHLVKAIRKILPTAHVISESYFCHEAMEDNIQTCYIEIATETGIHFTSAQLQHLKKELVTSIKTCIETKARFLFMPRNEEEVMRNVVALSSQLRFVKDPPQIILSFVEQTEEMLTFHVIVVRIFLEGMRSIQDLFYANQSAFTYIPDKVKKVGMLRKKYAKEASVFELRFAADQFIRDDYSVDLYRARQAVITELQRVLGGVRDYNGGMIARQIELLQALKQRLGFMNREQESVVEHFFHSIYPVEMRSLVESDILSHLFILWRQLVLQTDDLYRLDIEEKRIYFVKKGGVNALDRFVPTEMELLVAKLNIHGEEYGGYVLFTSDNLRRKQFFEEFDELRSESKVIH